MRRTGSVAPPAGVYLEGYVRGVRVSSSAGIELFLQTCWEYTALIQLGRSKTHQMYVADDQELCIVVAVEAILLSRLLVLIAEPVYPQSLFLTYH
jgi:hypothetical protein